MSGLEELPESVHRVLLFAIVLYFALILVDIAVGSPPAFVASQVLFGLIALGVGALLTREAGGERSPILAAGVSLAVGGAAQLVWIATGMEPGTVFDQLATIGVIVGIVLYVYAVWVAD